MTKENMMIVSEVYEANLRILKRYSLMEQRFDYLTKDMTDWKMPIKTTIPVKFFKEYCDACEYFTGTELYQTYCNGDGTMNVAANGYYMMGEA